jgi:hypothetical protein
MKSTVILTLLLFSSLTLASDPSAEQNYAKVFSNLAMDCVHKEYSNKIAHYMNSDDDLKPTRQSMATGC